MPSWVGKRPVPATPASIRAPDPRRDDSSHRPRTHRPAPDRSTLRELPVADRRDPRARRQRGRHALTAAPGARHRCPPGTPGDHRGRRHRHGPDGIERDYLRWGASTKKPGERIGRYGQGGKAAIGHLGNRFEVVASAAGDDTRSASRTAYRDRARLRTYDLHEPPEEARRARSATSASRSARWTARLDARRLRDRLAEVYRPLLDDRCRAADGQPRAGRAASLAARRATRHRVRAGVGSSAAGGGCCRTRRRRAPRTAGGAPLPPRPSRRRAGVVRAPCASGPPRPESTGRRGRTAPCAGHDEQDRRRPGQPDLGGRRGAPACPLDTDGPTTHARGAAIERDARGAAHRGPGATDPGPSAAPARVRAPVRKRGAGGLARVRAASWRSTGRHRPTGSRRRTTTSHRTSGDPETGDDGAGDAGSRQGCRFGRRRAAAEVVVRALDPRLRSAMVDEDGVRRVVINCAYPLYEVREGDLWYQLETALREVCVTIPEATVPEFERKVNELMLGLHRTDRPSPQTASRGSNLRTARFQGLIGRRKPTRQTGRLVSELRRRAQVEPVARMSSGDRRQASMRSRP